MSKYTDEDYKKLERQYKNDINKKIKLEHELKIKNSKIKRLERIIKSMESDMDSYSALFNEQTKIALHNIHLINNFINSIKSNIEKGTLDKDAGLEMLSLIDSEFELTNE